MPDVSGAALTPERWQTIKRIVQDGLGHPAARRPEFVAAACEGDAALQREVESLLAAADSASAVDRSAAAVLNHALAAALADGAAGATAPTGAGEPTLLARLSSALAGRYAVEHELGRGGMAVVYQARDLPHRRTVAIKVLRADLAASLGAARFRREITLAAGLQHPHIVPILDSGEADGALWFAMPCIEGGSLRGRLERERTLPVGDAVRIAQEVARGLDYAHRHGVVHRDVKPENILFSDGQAVVADFGIAKAVASSVPDTLTRTGFVLGTPAYMAPEQRMPAVGADQRTDVYALAVVVYEMLAGAPPAGPLSAATPFLDGVRTDVPAHVERAVRMALAPAPTDRFPTAAAFANALAPESALPAIATPSTATPSTASAFPRIRRRVAVAAAAVLALAGSALAFWRGGADAGDGVVDPDVIAVLPFRQDIAAGHLTLGGDNCARLLTDGLARWQTLRLSDEMRVADAWRGRGQDTLTVDGARRLARRLGAGRFVWGDVSEQNGVLRVSAQLYDSRRARPATYVARIAPRGDVQATFAMLADSLVAELAEAPGAARVASGTHNFDALKHYADGYAALHRWDMPAAERHFRAATELDAGFVQASLALAQTLAWSPGHAPDSWREPAARAVVDSAQLGARDRTLAAALLALAEKRMSDACGIYRRLLTRSPRDFAAQYGLGECLSRDRLVVRDPTDPRRWRFRGSLAEATAAYTRALELVPSYFGAARGQAFAALSERVLFTSSTNMRDGFALAPDTVGMAAWPELVGDTVTFRPVPFDTLFAHDEPPSHPAAVAHDREAMRDLTARWVDAYPRSALARRHYAETLEALGVLDDLSPGAPSALRAATEARRLGAVDESAGAVDITDAAAAEVRVLLKLGRFARARAVADSALADTSRVMAMPDFGSGAKTLAALAALTGRARLTARLLRDAGPSLDSLFFSPTDAGAPLPAPVRRAAADFLAYAALAAPADSLRATRARAERAIESWVPAGGRARARELVLGPGSLLAQPALGPSALRGVGGEQDEQIAAWQALARGDSTVVRRALGAWPPHRFVRDAPRAPEWLLQRAHLALAVRDTTNATAALDSLLAQLPRQSVRLTREFVTAAAFGRALALRHRLRRADPAADRAIQALWLHADEELRTDQGAPRVQPR